MKRGTVTHTMTPAQSAIRHAVLRVCIDSPGHGHDVLMALFAALVDFTWNHSVDGKEIENLHLVAEGIADTADAFEQGSLEPPVRRCAEQGTIQ